LDTGLAREYSGTGLGLAIVSQMIRLHGGHVSMESELGKGSCFSFTLPWVEQGQNAQAEVKAQVAVSRSTLSKDRSIKILLVEDTEVVVTLTSDYLRYKGYEVFIARNGLDGVLIAKEKKPDIILMDIMMPVMDGIEAAKRIRDDDTLQNTIIIALTALAMPGDREQCLAAGMNDYMSKPIQMQDLTATIENHLAALQEKINNEQCIDRR
jgi:CheY-like chemotaxis protein